MDGLGVVLKARGGDGEQVLTGLQLTKGVADALGVPGGQHQAGGVGTALPGQADLQRQVSLQGQRAHQPQLHPALSRLSGLELQAAFLLGSLFLGLLLGVGFALRFGFGLGFRFRLGVGFSLLLLLCSGGFGAFLSLRGILGLILQLFGLRLYIGQLAFVLGALVGGGFRLQLVVFVAAVLVGGLLLLLAVRRQADDIFQSGVLLGGYGCQNGSAGGGQHHAGCQQTGNNCFHCIPRILSIWYPHRHPGWAAGAVVTIFYFHDFIFLFCDSCHYTTSHCKRESFAAPNFPLFSCLKLCNLLQPPVIPSFTRNK